MTQSLAAAKPETDFSWTNALFFGAMHGLALLGFWCFSWQALGVTVFLHWLFGGIGICLTYHRLLTHRSLKVPRWLEYLLATIGSMALQGGPIFWVAGHRVHHAHTEDEVRDPYAASRGFWWSHMGWLLRPRQQFFDYELYKKYAPDLERQAYYRWLDRNFLMLQVPLGIVLFLVGGWSFVVYGIFVRSVVLWHTTWLINSATHWKGYQNFEVEDGSRNLWWAALLTYGEGWHNNHHARPRVAKAGLRWWEVDMTWWVICGLQRLGLATRIVR